MATVIKRQETRSENHIGNEYTKLRYVIKGGIYRVQIIAFDYDYKENPTYLAWVLHQSYHKYSSYRRCGELIYHGVNIKECWEEIESYTGYNTPIPDPIKQIQPFIANQT